MKFVATIFIIISLKIKIILSQSACQFINNGGYLTKTISISKLDSPCIISKNLIVPPKVTLTLESGVELRFQPGVYLAVNGTLIAKGTDNEKIVLTKNLGPNIDPVWPNSIRLVDDYTVQWGRLEIKYRDVWRGVCANYENWTQADVNVACKQLGFLTGNFSFESWPRNHSAYMLYFKPQCTGREDNILDCLGAQNIKYGPSICRSQLTIHLKCRGIHLGRGLENFWSGIEFYNTTIQRKIDSEKQTIINETSSVIEYVDISFAGVTEHQETVPALRADPICPFLINVKIFNCALDATNYTNVMSSTKIINSTFSNNRGHGLVVESNLGHINIRDSITNSNLGNGIKVKLLDGYYLIVDKLLTFCEMANQATSIFPQIISIIPNFGSECTRKFVTKIGRKITINFVEMDLEYFIKSTIEVYDGPDDRSNKIGVFEVINGSLPAGLTSSYHNLFVKFSWFKAELKRCSVLPDCVKVTIIVDSHLDSTPEFFMNNTLVSENLQHGVYIENMRNYIIINSSIITKNLYGAGIRVYGGAGDVLINSSLITYNADNGVNITHEGGWRIFNRTIFNGNFGNGVNITMNLTSVNNKTRYSRQQRTEVSRSTFSFNLGHGLSVGNFCRSANHIVNDSIFESNSGSAIEYLSCFKVLAHFNRTNFTIGYNIFRNNTGYAIKISPLLNTVGRICNNTFENHPKHVLLIDNTDDFLHNSYFQQIFVDYEIEANTFFNNKGHFVVNLRLTEGGLLQKMNFQYNVLQNNLIYDSCSPWSFINQRSRSRAVIIVSSSNIRILRNHLENFHSNYEISTHLSNMSAILNATVQWWGTTDYKNITMRIFDQYSRYNLGKILFHPVLAYSWLYGAVVTDRDIEIEVNFNRGNVLGGRLGTEFNTQPGKTYTIDRDIHVLGYGKLKVNPGTVFEFNNGIALLVEGNIEVDGTPDQRAVFKLSNLTNQNAVYENLNNNVHNDNFTFVKLSGGLEYEGRLEIRYNVSGDWGTVCNLGWTKLDASVACQTLGLAFHPDEFMPLERRKFISRFETTMPIVVSHVMCDDLDRNLAECDMLKIEDSNLCDHSMDVYLKCKPLTWAGIRMLASAPAGRFNNVFITEAGLFDVALTKYVPAFTIDYNVHELTNLIIKDNMADGLRIWKNDPYTDSKLVSSVVDNNYGSGISIRSSFFTLANSLIINNKKTGVEFNPSANPYEIFQIRSGIKSNYKLFEDDIKIKLNDYETKWFVTPQKFTAKSMDFYTEIEVSSQFRVVMDILDYNPDKTIESITVFDCRQAAIKDSSTKWIIDEDLVFFPVVSQLNALTVKWTVNSVSSGRLAFHVRSRPWNWQFPFGNFVIKDSSIISNRVGVSVISFNQPTNRFFDIFQRHRWDFITVRNSNISSNTFEAIDIESRTRYDRIEDVPNYSLSNTESISEIEVSIDGCILKGNGGGIKLEHSEFEYSSNIWIWQINTNVFEKNLAGGLIINLPKVNLLYTELYNHSVIINGSKFIGNTNFEFCLDGFYGNGSIDGNQFDGNTCLVGCITIAGTEKDFEFKDNVIIKNSGRYIMEVNMISHTPFTQWVDARINYNEFKDNEPSQTTIYAVGEQSSYTLGIRGIQNITVNRNLFSNKLQYEILGGQSASYLGNYLDASENWWGTTDQSKIIDLIFDFDDWNSFAIVEYHPYLTADSFDSVRTNEAKIKTILDLSKPLGGQINQNINLIKRSTPYIVWRDVTIMPQYSLIIEEGVQIQFYPNVGMLVLGSLVVHGSRINRVQFKPFVATTFKGSKRRVKRYVHPDIDPNIGIQLRLKRDDNKKYGENFWNNGGFLEIYNVTEQRWVMLCDDSFNEKTAEVVCRTMGLESRNAIVTRSPYYDIFVLGYPKMHEQVIEWFWRETLTCNGFESNLLECRRRENYFLSQCMIDRRYIYVRCGPSNLPSDTPYWGNIRFSSPSFETDYITSGYSSLQNLDIYGAGILHGERIAAIQSIYRVPDSNNVRIMNCASHGYDYFAPIDKFEIKFNTIINNYGYAIGTQVLNGQSSEGDSQFITLDTNALSYNVHGLLRMCTVEKLVFVRDRALLYHKYDFKTVDCVKVIRSKEAHRQVAVRFLQLKLFKDFLFPNQIQLFNSEFFNSENLITVLNSNSSDSARKRLYSTANNMDTLGIRITASPADGDYGFIAEIVTLPLSPVNRPDQGNLRQQSIMHNMFSGNEEGAILYRNVGENNPRLLIESNNIQSCGLGLMNNTALGVIDLFLQNTRLATVANNFMVDNAGGISINTTTKDNEVALFANISNNVITRTSHGEPIHLEGHHFQSFDMRFNYIAYNEIEFRNVLALFGVRVNFTFNLVQKNTAQCILNASVLEKVSINQIYMYNSIYNNYAFAYNKSTIFLKSAKFQFIQNYLVNPMNVYETVTFNKTSYKDGVYPTVDARNNYWGGSIKAYVAGRIWDRTDDDFLVGVDFDPIITDNTTILDGKCYPGWRAYSEKCYWYFGGVVTHTTAQTFCKNLRGRLAWAREPSGKERSLGEIISKFQYNYNVEWRTWIFKEGGNGCPYLVDYKVNYGSCDDLYPFICEKDPYIQPYRDWKPIIITLAISLAVIFLLLLPVLILCCVKSTNRKEERNERKDTLIKSVHASKTSLAGSKMSLHASRQSLDDLNKSYFSDTKQPRPNPTINFKPYDSYYKSYHPNTSSDLYFPNDSVEFVKPRIDSSFPSDIESSLYNDDNSRREIETPFLNKYIDQDASDSTSGFTLQPIDPEKVRRKKNRPKKEFTPELAPPPEDSTASSHLLDFNPMMPKPPKKRPPRPKPSQY